MMTIVTVPSVTSTPSPHTDKLTESTALTSNGTPSVKVEKPKVDACYTQTKSAVELPRVGDSQEKLTNRGEGGDKPRSGVGFQFVTSPALRIARRQRGSTRRQARRPFKRSVAMAAMLHKEAVAVTTEQIKAESRRRSAPPPPPTAIRMHQLNTTLLRVFPGRVAADSATAGNSDDAATNHDSGISSANDRSVSASVHLCLRVNMASLVLCKVSKNTNSKCVFFCFHHTFVVEKFD